MQLEAVLPISMCISALSDTSSTTEDGISRISTELGCLVYYLASTTVHRASTDSAADSSYSDDRMNKET